MAKPKLAAEMPRSTSIGRMKRPRLWRSPMQSEMIRPERRISRTYARRLMGSKETDRFTHGPPSDRVMSSQK
jgi:hypothetical protein